jgi:hypothetical protein
VCVGESVGVIAGADRDAGREVGRADSIAPAGGAVARVCWARTACVAGDTIRSGNLTVAVAARPLAVATTDAVWTRCARVGNANPSADATSRCTTVGRGSGLCGRRPSNSLRTSLNQKRVARAASVTVAVIPIRMRRTRLA